MKNAGAYLKSVREEKGYTVAELSKATKLSPSVVRALEEGRIDNVDSVYLKGFLKLYCRFVGIDWEAFIREYPVIPADNKRKNLSPLKPETGENKSKRQVIPSFKPSLVKFISNNRKMIALVLAVIAFLLFATIAFRAVVFLIKKLPPVFPPKVKIAAPQKSSVHKPPPKAPAKEKPAAAPVKTASFPVAKEAKLKDITLVIRSQEDSFLTVRLDGKLVYQRMMYKGKAESWSAKNKIELSVGNAGGIILELNGQVLPALGKKGQNLKNILINSEGLKVLQ